MSNDAIRLEEVFRTAGIPTYTFVEPSQFLRLRIALRTQGRPIIIEGPSGIGKTTAIQKALEIEHLEKDIIFISARKPKDIVYLNDLNALKGIGTVVIDDFHRLNAELKSSISDFAKSIADESRTDTRLILVGINDAGKSLLSFSPDLVTRVELVKFEKEIDSKISQIITLGEQALNVEITIRDEIINESAGSFYLAQMLCFEACLEQNIISNQRKNTPLLQSMKNVKSILWNKLGLKFQNACQDFAVGKKFRAHGRAPYFQLLRGLADSKEWTLDIRDFIRQNDSLKGSILQITEKGYLNDLIENNNKIRQNLFFDSKSSILSVEDPQFMFYIRNIPWKSFCRKIGYSLSDIKRKYDFALSFSGTQRNIAEALFRELTDMYYSVFYDYNEQYRIAGNDIKQYLRPIYESEAAIIILLIDDNYPKKIWTQFEHEAALNSDTNIIIPIFIDGFTFDFTSKYNGIGRYDISTESDVPEQIKEIAISLQEKIEELNYTDVVDAHYVRIYGQE